MLGDQAWAPPDTYDTFNAGARLNLPISRKWAAFAAAGLSHSLIQDNVIYAYGSSIDPNTYLANCPNAPNAPAYFFCPDGTYGIYDYRDPGELRQDGELEAMATGQLKTGALTHFITLGGELFLRSVQMPGYDSINSPVSPDGITQDGAVYAYLGPENIYQPLEAYPIENPVETAGPRRLWEDSRQSSAVLQDRVQLPGRVQLIAGGRYDALRDHNYSAQASDLHHAHAAHRSAGVAAAVRDYLKPRAQSHTLRKLRRRAVAGAAGTVVGRQLQPVSQPLQHAAV